MLPSKLLYFITLAGIENYTKAAEKLEISQPTLSNNIALLEKELGAKLFEKSGRSIMLTKSGEVFLEYAKKCVMVLEEGKAEVRRLGSEVSGSISVAHINVHTDELLPGYIKRFLENSLATSTQFDLHIAMTKEIIAGIKADKYDVGFCFRGEPEPDIEYLPLWMEEFVIIVGPDHVLAQKGTVCIHDTTAYPHITYSEKSLVYDAVVDYYTELKKYPDIVGSVESVGAMIGLVSGGVGIGFAPISCVTDRENVKIVHISDVETRTMVYMVYDRNKYQIPYVKRFVRYMEQYHRLGN